MREMRQERELAHQLRQLADCPFAKACPVRRPGCWLAGPEPQPPGRAGGTRIARSETVLVAEGLLGAEKLFIAPPVRGWIKLSSPGPVCRTRRDDIDACHRFVLEASRKLGQVQLFSANHPCIINGRYR